MKSSGMGIKTHSGNKTNLFGCRVFLPARGQKRSHVRLSLSRTQNKAAASNNAAFAGV
jgi:hypothetical protein